MLNVKTLDHAHSLSILLLKLINLLIVVTDFTIISFDNFRNFDLTFFDKMGVTGIRSQYPGTIDYYILNTGLKIAAEVIDG